MKYDDVGRKTSQRYFDAADQPTTHVDGNHGCIQEFDSAGNVVSIRYFNTLEQPMLHPDGYHGWNAKVDSDGREVSSQYIGVEGEELFGRGVRIKKVLSDSNAERSGLAAMDLIVWYHGQHPQSFDELVNLIETVAKDDSIERVEVVVEREGEKVTMQVEKGKLGAAIVTKYGPRDEADDSESKDGKAQD